MQDPFHSQPPQYQPDPSVTPPPPPPSGEPYQSSPNYPVYPSQQHTTYPPQPAYPTPPQAYPTVPQPYPPSPYGAPNQPPRKQQPLLWIIIGVLLVVILVGGFAFALANHGSPTPTPTPTAQTGNGQPTSAPTQGGQATTLPTNSPSGTHKVGDSATLDGWTLKVNAAKISQGGPYDTPQKAGDVYLEIDISATNQTGKAQDFSSFSNIIVKDSSGQQYDQTFASDAPKEPTGTVQNGGTIRGTVVYEVAPSMKTFELDFEPDPFGSTDVATWSITVS